MEKLQVGMVGLGTVGTGVAKLMLQDAAWLQGRTGTPLQLKTISDLDLDRDRGVDLGGVSLTRNVNDILEDLAVKQLSRPGQDVIVVATRHVL